MPGRGRRRRVSQQGNKMRSLGGGKRGGQKLGAGRGRETQTSRKKKRSCNLPNEEDGETGPASLLIRLRVLKTQPMLRHLCGIIVEGCRGKIVTLNYFLTYSSVCSPYCGGEGQRHLDAIPIEDLADIGRVEVLLLHEEEEGGSFLKRVVLENGGGGVGGGEGNDTPFCYSQLSTLEWSREDFTGLEDSHQKRFSTL